MAINKVNIVDFVSTNTKANKAIMTIVDDIDWEFEGVHLKMLQEKINSYIAFVETKQIYESYPDAIGKDLEIEIFFKYDPTKNCTKLLKLVRNKLKNEVDIDVSWKHKANK